MTLAKKVEWLRRELNDLAADTDDDLLERYDLRRPPVPPGLYWRLRWLAGTVLRWLRSIGPWRSRSWPASLREGRASARAKPLLIWALGADRDTVRSACDGFSTLLGSSREFAPVLVTDVADFAFFSRLGWLVEYVPRLAGEGAPYDQRKVKFLARLYSGAPALPLTVGLETSVTAADIRSWLVGQ